MLIFWSSLIQNPKIILYEIISRGHVVQMQPSLKILMGLHCKNYIRQNIIPVHLFLQRSAIYAFVFKLNKAFRFGSFLEKGILSLHCFYACVNFDVVNTNRNIYEFYATPLPGNSFLLAVILNYCSHFFRCRMGLHCTLVFKSNAIHVKKMCVFKPRRMIYAVFYL